MAHDGPFDFELAVGDCRALRTMVSMVSAVVQRIPVEVKLGSSFSGLSVECMSEDQTSMVISQLACDMRQCSQGNRRFCIESRLLKEYLRGVRNLSELLIRRRQGSDNVEFVNFGGAGSNHSVSETELSTLVEDQRDFVVQVDQYDVQMEVELAHLKSMVEMATTAQASDLNIKVDDLKDTSTGKHFTAVELSVRGVQAEQRKTMYASRISGGGDLEAIPDMDIHTAARHMERTREYRGRFSAEKIGNFLRSVDSNRVQIKLKDGQPLLLMHEFEENSFVCFLLAPKTMEDDEDMVP